MALQFQTVASKSGFLIDARVANRATGMGIFYTWYYVLMAVLPGCAGLLRDLSGSPAAPIFFAAAMVLLCALVLLLFHAARRMPET